LKHSGYGGPHLSLFAGQLRATGEKERKLTIMTTMMTNPSFAHGE
jgi:hypothetical protein